LYVLLSQPLHRRHILGAKLAGGILALALALLLVITGGVAAIGMFGPRLWVLLPAGTFLSLYLAGLLYLVSLYALGLVIGTLSSSVASANTWAISLWLIVVLSSVPALDFAIKTFLPVTPLDTRIATRVSEFNSRLDQTELALGDLLVQLAGPHDIWRVTEITTDMIPTLTRAWTDGMGPIRQAVTALDTQTTIGIERQRWWQRQLSLLSPATAFFEVVSCLNGTATPTARRWEQAVDEHQRFLNDHLFDAPPRLTLLVPQRQGGRTIQTVPIWPVPRAVTFEHFTVPQESLAMRARDARQPVVALAGWAILFTIVAFVAFENIRY
jgi:ABC-type transport system involved in multi-copper enzyme maturation permease subunit